MLNSTLTSLDLSDNEIKAPGMKYLCDSLIYNNTLSELDLSKNKIGEEGSKYLCQVLEINSSLKKVVLDKTSFEIDQKIFFLLECNIEWNPFTHSLFFDEFKSTVFCFLVCLNEKQKNFFFKIPKFVKFEIIKKIERKSYLDKRKKREIVPFMIKEKKRKREYDIEQSSFEDDD